MTRTPPPPPALDWSVFLDVDGTLIDFATTPFDARVDAGLKKLLADVVERLGGALALVSGRSIERLDELFAPLRLPSAGLHGVERRTASGALQGAGVADDKLDGARTVLRDFVDAHPGTLLEDKGRTVALHFRLAPQFEREVCESIAAVATALGEGYHVQGGSMMLEIKPRGFSKGGAIAAFMQEPPFSGKMPVFVGDDITDLDGFRAVERLGGLSVAVGERVQGNYHLADPDAVRRWLAEILARVAPPEG